MAEEHEWAFAEELQPKPEDTQFDLARALDCMVLLRVEVPEDAFSATTLGTERTGYGAVIRADGLVVTIGYLIAEASQIWLTTNGGAVVAGYPLAYDHATGFGLVQPLGELNLAYLRRGAAADLKTGDRVYALGHGGRGHALKTQVIARQEFAGRWEYVLDDAVFTAPAHPQWGGAGLVDARGDLVGVGSLLLQQQVGGESVHVNMFVPIDLLEPILDAMVATGRSPLAPRPWLGMSTEDVEGKLIVGRVSPAAPAQRAGIRVGDTVVAVVGQRVQTLAELFRAVWRLGPAGVEVPLTVVRNGDVLRITVKSSDRNDFLRKPRLH